MCCDCRSNGAHIWTRNVERLVVFVCSYFTNLSMQLCRSGAGAVTVTVSSETVSGKVLAPL